MIIRIVVVFPAPFGPINPKITPLGTSSERLSTARKVPNDLTSPRNETAASIERSSTRPSSSFRGGRSKPYTRKGAGGSRGPRSLDNAAPRRGEGR